MGEDDVCTSSQEVFLRLSHETIIQLSVIQTSFSGLGAVTDSHLEYLRVWNYDLHDLSSGLLSRWMSDRYLGVSFVFCSASHVFRSANLDSRWINRMIRKWQNLTWLLVVCV